VSTVTEKVNSKRKVVPIHNMKTHVGIEVYLHSFLTATLEVVENVKFVRFVTMLRLPICGKCSDRVQNAVSSSLSLFRWKKRRKNVGSSHIQHKLFCSHNKNSATSGIDLYSSFVHN
jgi:hypothetical protein